MNNDLNKIVCDKLNRFVEIINIHSDLAVAKTGLTAKQIVYLELIDGSENSTPTKIADKLNLSKPTVTVALNNLFEGKFIEKAQSPADKRFYYLELTPRGNEALKMIRNSRNDAISGLLSGLTRKETIQLGWLMNKIIDSESI